MWTNARPAAPASPTDTAAWLKYAEANAQRSADAGLPPGRLADRLMPYNRRDVRAASWSAFGAFSTAQWSDAALKATRQIPAPAGADAERNAERMCEELVGSMVVYCRLAGVLAELHADLIHRVRAANLATTDDERLNALVAQHVRDFRIGRSTWLAGLGADVLNAVAETAQVIQDLAAWAADLN